VSTLFKNLTTLEEYDPVGVDDGREAMRDDDRRSANGCTIESLLDYVFTLKICVGLKRKVI